MPPKCEGRVDYVSVQRYDLFNTTSPFIRHFAILQGRGCAGSCLPHALQHIPDATGQIGRIGLTT
eukprot:752583-Pyramimonas_sp.AAC.1